jgi:hypothetical protein
VFTGVVFTPAIRKVFLPPQEREMRIFINRNENRERIRAKGIRSVTLCSLVNVYRRFGEKPLIHVQGNVGKYQTTCHNPHDNEIILVAENCIL